ncbi:CLUMA_CG015348, isoform A [Clunio marinus]|uniref:CLUMA_CG015348, isoform A n=1 Tax=Clunio marinus TaxID=568069 RepID=A0A1J1IP54_9DIPT|nr:CLUMA_CG015348, isoform A [Clunio marinus]
MMNKNNRKTNNASRPSQAGPGSRSRPQPAEGVYNNSHFLHAATSQVGNNVCVQTKGGVIVEGIFKAFSENFSVALEVPHRYKNDADDKNINVETVQDNLIIKLCDIVTMHAKDVDLDYAIRDTFQTDTAISSRLNGALRNKEKTLQPWLDGVDAVNGDMGISLELDSQTNGWDANEMFQLNEKEHGIKTTFKDNLENYTVQLEKKDTIDFRKQELEAERIANEIESNPVTKDRLDVENGDEEAAFAAVSRPSEENNSTNSNSNNNNEKMTPPPSASASSQKYIPQQKRNDRKMMTTNTKPMYSKAMQSSGLNNPHGGIQSNTGPQPVQQTINAVTSQHMGKPPTMGIHMPPPHLQNVADGQQTIHVVTQHPVVLPPPTAVVVPTLHMHPAPQPQRPQRDPMMRSRNDEIRSLRTFHNDFSLGSSAPPGQQQNVPPQVPNSQQQQQQQAAVSQQRPDMQDNGQNPMSHPPPSTQNIEMGKVQQQQQHSSGVGGNNNNNNNSQHHNQQHHPTPSSTPHADKTHGQSSTTPPQATTPQNSVNNVNNSSNSSISVGNNSNSNETTPPSSSSSSSLNDKLSLGGTKKFTLNPQAKPFTPRSPSTPTQSRPTPPPMAVRSNKFQPFQVSQATGQPIFNPPVHPQVMQAYNPHAHQMQTVQSQSYPSTAIRMYPGHDGQQQAHITSYLVPTPPSTTPSPGQPHQPTFHPGPQPSPAAGPPQQGFPPQGQYVMFMPSYAAPQFVNSNQHNPQQLQVVMSQQQQHSAQ